jgi:RNA polymerase sigma-70 factor, ECF subfamily
LLDAHCRTRLSGQRPRRSRRQICNASGFRRVLLCVIAEVSETRPLSPSPGGARASDNELLEGIASRRAGSFEALVEAYQNRLYGLAWRVVGSREDAEEAVQDALVKAHRALYRTYSETRVRELTLRPWLFAVTLNAVRNQLRGQRPSHSLDDTSDDGLARIESLADDADPGAGVDQRELGEALEQALSTLQLRYRAAVVVRMIEGLSYDEAAQALGRPIGTVKSDVHRGLRLLQKRLRGLLEGGSL